MPGLTNIYSRTDGNTEIATGHIMRCLAIARACVRQNAAVKFIVSDEESLTLLQARFHTPDEFDLHCLHSDYRNMDAELSGLVSYLAADTDSKPWLFIDSYFATPAYFAALRPHCQVAYLDDLRNFPCEVDLVIHYDTETDCIYYHPAARKLLGSQYTPLRAQFEHPSYTVRTTVRNILLSTGGTDPYGVAEHLLQNIFHSSDAAFQSLQEFDYHIVTSKANSRYDILLAMTETNPRIHIHEGVSDMASLMASCDLAVSAGGTTLCELCAVGVPAISYLMAENQRTAVDTFAQEGLIPFAGDIRLKNHAGTNNDFLPNNSIGIDQATTSNILFFLTHMSHNAEARKKSSQFMRAFLDGQGAKRIAEAMIHP